MNVILTYFIIINTIGFLLIWHDKNQAIKNRYRVSEKILLLVVALGSAFGLGLAMQIFRHKTTKKTFLIPFYGIIVIQFVILCFIFIK